MKFVCYQVSIFFKKFVSTKSKCYLNDSLLSVLLYFRKMGFPLLALGAGLIGGLFGFRKTQSKIEGAADGIQTSIDTTLKNVHQEMVMFREKLETDFIPEAKETMFVARESMTSLVHTVYNTSVVAQESMRGLVEISRAFMNRAFITMGRVDDVLIQMKFGVEIGLIMLFVVIVILCGHELRRTENVLRPSAYMLFERDLMRMLRISCIMSCLALAGKLFYALILSKSQAEPDDIIRWALLPIVVIIVLNLCRLLKPVFSSYILPIVGFILWIPVNLLFYPLIILLYSVCLQPTVWLGRVYKNRHQLRNHFCIYVIRFLPIIIPVLLILIFELITTYMFTTMNLETGLLLAMTVVYVLYYITAYFIMINCTIQTVRQNVRKVYVLKYRQ